MDAGKHRGLEEQKETGKNEKTLILKRQNLAKLGPDVQSLILSFLFPVIITNKTASMFHNMLSAYKGIKFYYEDNKAEAPAEKTLETVELTTSPESNHEKNVSKSIETSAAPEVTSSASDDDKAVSPVSKKLRLFKPVYKATKSGAMDLVNNYVVLYEDQIKQMAHNLLFHKGVDETLAAFKDAGPGSERIVFELNDPHNQRVKGTTGQILKAAGDRNTREMKSEEKNYGLVERLRSCFKDPSEYDRLLIEWEKGSKEATEKTMAPYRKAIEALCKEIIESKEISDDVPFETLLDLPFAKKFRDALKPDPNHVVTSGLLFDIQIFLDFISIFETNVNKLGGWWSLRSDLFDALVYPALQARTQRIDYEIFKKGIANVASGQLPAPADFLKGVPAEFAGFGKKSHYFGFYGNEYRAGPGPAGRRAGRRGGPGPRGFFDNCIKQKQQPLELHCPKKDSDLTLSLLQPCA